MNNLDNLTLVILTYKTGKEILDNCLSSIDKNIKYYRIDTKLNFHCYGIETDNIIEMKLEDINRISSLDNDFLSAYRVRFSKYCQAVRKIKLIN